MSDLKPLALANMIVSEPSHNTATPPITRPASGLRIGQFTDSFPPIVNGVSAFVAEHHRELLGQGHRAQVFTFGYTRYADSLPAIWRTPGIPLGDSHFRGSMALKPGAAQVVAGLDVLHMHEATMAAGWITPNLAWRFQKPLIFTNHTRHDLYVANYPSLVRPFLGRYVSSIIRQAIRNSDLITAPSGDTARWLRTLAPECANRVHVVPNGIRLDWEEWKHTRPADRAALGIPDNATVFIYIGRLTPEKNLMALTQAMRIAIQAGANAYWLIVGDGTLRAQLQAKTSEFRDHVRFMGQVSREQVNPLLATADVLVTCSLSEVNPVSVIEALAAGKPYLGLQAAWWDEFAEDTAHSPAALDNHAGATTPSPDHSYLTRFGGWLTNTLAELGQMIHRLCNQPKLIRDMGIQARQLSARFDIREIASRWVELYSAIIETRPYASTATTPQRIKRLLRPA